ncbi:MAG: RHS repeat protein, partial [FCB group bacterium]|nr:RHS repeat protein [FCB group bacterium]
MKYLYDDKGRVISEVRSYLDTPSSWSSASARTISYDYSPVDLGDSQDPKDENSPRTVTEYTQAKSTSKTYYAYLTDADGGRVEIVERCVDPSAVFGDESNQRTISTYYPKGAGSPGDGLIKSIAYPDGRMDSTVYESGVWDGVTFTPGNGEARRDTVVHGTVAGPMGIAGKTTQEASVRNALGSVVRMETHIYTGSSYDLISWSVNAYDDNGRLVSTVRSDGTKTESDWGCCNKESDTDAWGVQRFYTYDDLDRIEISTKKGAAAQGDVVTTYTYDAAGRQKNQTITAGGLSMTTSNEYDDAGRLKNTTDAAGLVTEYDYSPDGRTITKTRPGGATEVTERYIDGRVKSVAGTGVVARYYEYGVNEDGIQWTTVFTAGASSPMWEKTTVDLLGRTIHIEKPGFADVEVAEYFYNTKGQLVKTTISGQADMLFVYDELGNQTRSGLDVDGSGELSIASNDRITETDAYYEKVDGSWWQKTEQTVYAGEEDGQATEAGIRMTRASGLGNGKVGETVSIDIHGNQTVSTTSIDRAQKTETQTVYYPDSTINAVSVSVNGLLSSSSPTTGVTLTYEYDALERRIGLVDPRTGKAKTHYNEKGRVDYVEDAVGNRTWFAYDPATGQKAVETDSQDKITRYAYNTMGRMIRTWGDAAYPVEYMYDDYGRMTEMHTFRNEAGWTDASWPEGGAADVTKWHYQEATGLLLQKEDAVGKTVSYTYTYGGKLKTRTWARLD